MRPYKVILFLGLIIEFLMLGIYLCDLLSSYQSSWQNGGGASPLRDGDDKYGLPVMLFTNQGQIIRHTGFILSYNSTNHISNWVMYELTQAEASGNQPRENRFYTDPMAMGSEVTDADYHLSGWSRGHMAPAADMKWSSKAMLESCYYTNICPQNQSLNAGQWRTLEQKVRDWAKKFGSVTVVTGPIVGNNINGSIGPNRVVVPDAFFKVIITGSQSIAFVMKNKSENDNLQSCAMSVDSLEELSGIDFFPALDDVDEEKIESTYTLRLWNL